jgi:TetR/AcrR family transcriptional regulator, transcriptional repressor for nem operon
MNPTPATKDRLLDAALGAFRLKGYSATSVDDICRQAGVTKGAFFHHFKGKEELAVASAAHWTAVTEALFAQAPYQQIADPRQRLLGYIDFRSSLIEGEIADFTCLLGTMVQETYATSPAIRDACNQALAAHAATLEPVIAAAKRQHAPRARWQPLGLALHMQATIQGAFILAKAQQTPAIARDCLSHLRNYVASLLPAAPPSPRSGATH